jgi:hypothetical protein
VAGDRLTCFLVVRLSFWIAGFDVECCGGDLYIVRVGYAFAYVLISSNAYSYVRSMVWWASNIACIWTLIQSGKAINS